MVGSSLAYNGPLGQRWDFNYNTHLFVEGVTSPSTVVTKVWLFDGSGRSDLRRPFSDGTHAVVFAPYEFIEKLCALIPPPRANLVTYHGVLAPAHTWRARIVSTINIDDRSPLPCRHPATSDDDTTDATERVRRHTWAELMRRVFDLDVLECPHCGGRRRLIALITDPPVIRAILDALGIQPAPRAPPPYDFALN